MPCRPRERDTLVDEVTNHPERRRRQFGRNGHGQVAAVWAAWVGRLVVWVPQTQRAVRSCSRNVVGRARAVQFRRQAGAWVSGGTSLAAVWA
jgi:hypothetical protein